MEDVFFWCANIVTIAGILSMLFLERLRLSSLTYAIWTGALALCLAGSRTFSTGHFGQ